MADETGMLLDRARSGDGAALRMLLERHGPAVWVDIDSQIGGRFRSMIDADDVMQITYLEAFMQIDRLSAADETAFMAWLRQIARNNLRDAIKELGRRKRPDPSRRVQAPVGEDSYVALVEMLGATSATPSRAAAKGETSRIIGAILDKLPKDYQTVIRLYDLECREISDVAAAMGRSTGAVHMLRARAHDRLRELIGSESNFFSHSA